MKALTFRPIILFLTLAISLTKIYFLIAQSYGVFIVSLSIIFIIHRQFKSSNIKCGYIVKNKPNKC